MKQILFGGGHVNHALTLERVETGSERVPYYLQASIGETEVRALLPLREVEKLAEVCAEFIARYGDRPKWKSAPDRLES